MASKRLVTSGSATIEHVEFVGNKLFYFVIGWDRRLVDLPFLQIKQGGSAELPDFDFNDVFREFDVEGWACNLFVLGSGHQQHPE